MMSYRSNPEKASETMPKTLSELTTEYNVLARKAGRKTVKKLRDVKSAQKKIADLKETKATKKASVDSRSAISKEFDCRVGTNREKMIEALASAKGKQVSRSDLLKAVYGSQKEENVGPLSMVLKGVYAMIKDGRLPYKIERSRDAETKEVSFGLCAK